MVDIKAVGYLSHEVEKGPFQIDKAGAVGAHVQYDYDEGNGVEFMINRRHYMDRPIQGRVQEQEPAEELRGS